MPHWRQTSGLVLEATVSTETLSIMFLVTSVTKMRRNVCCTERGGVDGGSTLRLKQNLVMIHQNRNAGCTEYTYTTSQKPPLKRFFSLHPLSLSLFLSSFPSFPLFYRIEQQSNVISKHLFWWWTSIFIKVHSSRARSIVSHQGYSIVEGVNFIRNNKLWDVQCEVWQ